jgi:hypothetical protein
MVLVVLSRRSMERMMAQFVVREVEWGGDVDGTGPERWLGRELGRFDTEDQALDFVDTQWTDCEVVEED